MRIPVTPIAVALSITASAGCFYVDPINQRPSLDIRPASDDPVYRGGTVTLAAVASDPEDQFVEFEWDVRACTDAAAASGGCDSTTIFSGTEPLATFPVPPFREDPDGSGPLTGAPVQSLRVILRGHDDHGAEARPEQELILPVLNHPPEVALRKVATYGAVVGTPIIVYAQYGDPDDTPANVTLEWTAFSPSQVPDTLVDAPPPAADPGHLQEAKRFTPAVTGNWDIRVVAVDKLGARTEEHLTVTVADDAPPCLDTWAPIASTAATPVTEPTLFQIIHVRDDLDAYPRGGPDSFIGETAFQWSIKVGAGPRQPLANAVSSLAFDPDAYAPGTIVELRVQIFDRKNTAITCADDVQTCSVISQPSCIQRQTWRVEAR